MLHDKFSGIHQHAGKLMNRVRVPLNKILTKDNHTAGMMVPDFTGNQLFLGNTGGNRPGTDRFRHHESAGIGRFGKKRWHIDRGADLKHHVDRTGSDNTRFQAHFGKIFKSQHVVNGHSVGNEKHLVLEKLLIRFAVVHHLVAHHDAAVAMRKKHQTDGHAVVE